MSSCCTCAGSSSGAKSSLPLICLVPRDTAQAHEGRGARPRPASARPSSAQSDFELLDEEYIKKHFKLPQRSLYLDPFRRPLITFPMTQEDAKNFNLARKYKINQQILDGFLDPSAAISAPSVFPYAKSESEKRKEKGDDEEIIYILQLPDWEFKCPVHNQTIKTPSPLVRPGFDALSMSAPVLVQMNPDGKWENSAPGSLDEERLKAVVAHLVSSKAVSAAQSYCCQCACETQKDGSGKLNYVPVIMMPIYSADQCPFDMDCEVQKMKDAGSKPTKKSGTAAKAKEAQKEKDTVKKPKKRGFVLQRLTNFDLLSQW